MLDKMRWKWDALAMLPDKRLVRRRDRLVERLSGAPNESLPQACGGWAESKACYRFLG